jgi:gag-polypeptide of LTR copia-type
MATEPTPTLPIVPRTSHPIQFTHQIHTSLHQENFLLWKSQVFPVLRGHGLLGFLDDTKPAPPTNLTNAQGIFQTNPAYEPWVQQDQLILAWIFSSISPSILNQVVRCETSAQVWSTLNQFYSSQSIAKTLDLKLQLQTTKKGGNSCSQYIQHIQNLTNHLRNIGAEVSDQDLLVYIAQGLGSDFDPFVTAIFVRFSLPSMTEFSSMLLTHEARVLNNLRSSSTSVVHLTTNIGNSDFSSADHLVYYINSKSQNSNTSQAGSNTYKGKGRGRGGRWLQRQR